MSRDRALLALAVTGTAIGVAGTALAEVGIAANPRSALGDVLYAATAATYSATALVLLARRRTLGIAWLILGIGAVTGVEAAVNAFAHVAYTRSGHLPVAELTGWERAGPLLAQLSDLLWIPSVVGTIVLFVVFPDGRPPTPRFRWLVRLDVALAVLFVLVVLVAPDGTDYPRWVRPLVELPVPDWFGAFSGTLLLVMVIGSAAAVLVRYRRSDTVTRQQLKWVVWIGFLLAVTVVLGTPADFWSPFWSDVSDVASNLVIATFPVAVGVAVSRYRLFDIDRLLSRTVSYTLLSAIVAGLFTGVVLLVSQIGLGSNWGVAAATLASLAALSPLRRRLQHLVDRRFDRARVDGVRTAEAFALRLRDEVDLDTVRAELLATVTRALAPTGASVWLAR